MCIAPFQLQVRKRISFDNGFTDLIRMAACSAYNKGVSFQILNVQSVQNYMAENIDIYVVQLHRCVQLFFQP